MTPEGEADARRAAADLAGVPLDAVASSDLHRARRTAELVGEVLGLGEPLVEPRLRERSVGEWEGLTFDEIQAGWPGMIEEYRAGRLETPPGGEPLAEFRARIVAGLAAVASAHDGGRVLAVAHGGVLRALDRMLAVEPMRPVNCSGRWLLVDGSGTVQAGECWFPDGATPARLS